MIVPIWLISIATFLALFYLARVIISSHYIESKYYDVCFTALWEDNPPRLFTAQELELLIKSFCEWNYTAFIFLNIFSWTTKQVMKKEFSKVGLDHDEVMNKIEVIRAVNKYTPDLEESNFIKKEEIKNE